MENWLYNFQAASEVAPIVFNMLDDTNWEIDALENRPDIASEIPFGDISVYFREDLSNLMNNLPMIPTFGATTIPSTSASSTSSTASVYTYVSHIGDLPDENARNYSISYRNSYERLQSEHNRPYEVRKLLESFNNDNILERFDRANKSFSHFQIDPENRTIAAGEIRTFLDGLKGLIFLAAKNNPSENNPSWDEVASRLCRDKNNEFFHNKIAKWECKYGDFIDRLSRIFKDREGGSETDLTILWTELLDNVFTLLNMIDISKDKSRE